MNPYKDWNAAIARARADYARSPFERLIDNQAAAIADGWTYRETRASRAKDAQAARDRRKAS